MSSCSNPGAKIEYRFINLFFQSIITFDHDAFLQSCLQLKNILEKFCIESLQNLHDLLLMSSPPVEETQLFLYVGRD